MKRNRLLLLVVLLPLASLGQLDESDTLQTQVRVDLNGQYQAGNVTLFLVRSRAELSTRLGENLVFKTQNNYLYQEFSGRRADEDLNSRNYLYYRPQRRWYPFAMAFLQTNYRRKLDLRFFSGAGLSWKVIDQPMGFVKLSASLVYEHNRFNGSNFNQDRYDSQTELNFWRPTAYIQAGLRLNQGQTRISGHAYVQSGVQSTQNQRLQLELVAEQQLWRRLHMSIHYSYWYEQLAVVGILPTDKLLSLGLRWQLIKKITHDR